MKIVATSDLHGYLPNIPECDLLLIAGDVCPVWNHKLPFQRHWLETRFRNWLSKAPARHVVGVWGNHDLIAERAPLFVPDLPWMVLTDQLHEWEGLKIYGLPWQRRFFDWAFNLAGPELAAKYEQIPDCDIIVSHGPPYGFGDNTRGESVGIPAFNDAIERSMARIVVYGHIHCDPGQWLAHGATLANVSYLNDAYKPQQQPVVFADFLAPSTQEPIP